MLRCVHFSAILLETLSSLVRIRLLRNAAIMLPRTWAGLLKRIGFHKSNFERYVVCPECSTVYELQHAIVKTRTGVQSRECQYARFPGHRQARMRKNCGAKLMKTVSTAKGEALQARKVYAFRSVHKSLAQLFQRKQFVENLRVNPSQDCAHRVPTGDSLLADIYDGEVWKEFERNGFFVSKFNLSLTMNVDWFRPFKRAQYSLGVIYFVINNLPRDMRFKEENIIIAGIIPGPREPSRDINPFLQPIVDDLIPLWTGKVFDVVGHGSVISRSALMCVASDSPASRKVGGFLGHQALHGCTKCLKQFMRNGFNGRPNYAGFVRTSWKFRTNNEHRKFANKSRLASTESERSAVEQQFGARYSQLYRLEYYDCVRFLVIDPMHNLFLGTAKHIAEVWRERGFLTDESLQLIEERIHNLHVPAAIGRIPEFSVASLSALTADQWRNWTCIFSAYALKGILPQADYDCWMHFVEASQLICLRTTTIKHIERADSCLLSFAQAFEKLYGAELCMPNMHMHLHLKEIFIDYGPASAIWLFSFERYNGLLGSYNTNMRDIGPQIMRHFMLNQFVTFSCAEMPHDDVGWFNGIMSYLRTVAVDRYQRMQGSLQDTRDQSCRSSLLGRLKLTVLDDEEEQNLNQWFVKAYSTGLDSVEISSHCESAKVAVINGIKLHLRPSRLCLLLAQCQLDHGLEIRPCYVQRLLRHEAIVTRQRKKNTVNHLFLEVAWLKEHPQKDFFGANVQVWCKECELSSSSTYILPENVLCEVAYITETVKLGKVGRDHVTIIIPCPKYAHALTVRSA